MNKNKVIIIFLLVFSIVLSTINPIFATESTTNTIYINTARDLNKLAKDSSIDTWSNGKTVVLNNNIDLKGKAFTPIPIFNGIFEGNGYTINGLVINIEGSNQGLFRYIQKDGIVRNLHIEGVVNPKGDRSTIGGIVGENNGTIDNCKFSGYIKGKDIVGGIVGWNSSSGKVINSSFDGIIYGESKIGGITGYNNGSIIKSTNESNVNTILEEEKTDIINIDLENFSTDKLTEDAMDIGGVAGINTGIINGCINRGTVGYNNYGYNIGGIAGKQSGYITDCDNYGTIKGRRKVGGIVGQMEPYIKLIIPPSKLERFKEELNYMESITTRLMNNTKTTNDLMSKNLSNLENNINSSMSNVQSLIEQVENMVGDGIEQIDLIFAEIMKIITPFMDAIPGMVVDIENMVQYFNEIIEYLSNIFVDNPESVEKIEKLISLFEKLIKDMNETIKWLNETYKLIKEISNSKEHITKDQIISLLGYLKNIRTSIENSWNSIVELSQYITELIEIAELPEVDLEDILNQLKESLDFIKGIGSSSDDIIKGINDLINLISNQPDFDFNTINDIYLKLKDGLFSSIGNMSSSMFNLIGLMSEQGSLMIDDMEKLNNQMFVIMDLLMDTVEEMTSEDVKLEDIIQDVSSEEVEKTTEGKVEDSVNHGDIHGDINVGGIAGAMSIDFTMDPEKDLNLGDRFSINSIFQTRAVIINCRNKGDITNKKDNIGGIVGNMDLGYIKNCISSGQIESIDGNYIGGIAGKSVGPIDSSYSKNLLKGGNNIGGISGFGKNIKNSYSLVRVDENKARVGAIAGYVEDRKDINNNYFVSDTLRGIDSISYSGVAEPISYEQLISRENIPSIFKEFKISFWVGDSLIDTLDFNFGDSLPKSKLPDIPAKKGYFGRWEEIDTKNTNFDLRVEAEYFPYLTVIESNKERQGIPIVLVEGLFTDEDFLIFQENTLGKENEENYLEQWTLKIPDNNKDKNIVRFNPPQQKGNFEIYKLVDNTWKKVKTKRDGKYIVFEADKNNIVFRVKESKNNYFNIIAFNIIIALGFIIIIRNIKNNKTKLKI